MDQSLGLVSLVVRDYDEALAFFVDKLGFELVEDRFIPEEGKRWVVVRPPGGGAGAQLLLARASTPEQQARVGSQTGGRVGFFLYTDDFWRDHARFTAHGIEFVRGPAEQPYGTVAVFKDLYGSVWDEIRATDAMIGRGVGSSSIRPMSAARAGRAGRAGRDGKAEKRFAKRPL
jgi:catechol 2,3-dioxygenase-like lactoylglutathione lyase family enzyme